MKNTDNFTSLENFDFLNELNRLKWTVVNHYLISAKDIPYIKKLLKHSWFKQLQNNWEINFNFKTTYYDFPWNLLLWGETRIRLREYPNWTVAIEWKINTKEWLLKKERLTSTNVSSKIWLPENRWKILNPLLKTVKTIYDRESFIFNVSPKFN